MAKRRPLPGSDRCKSHQKQDFLRSYIELIVVDIVKDVQFPVDDFIDVSSPFAAEEPEPALALSQGPTGARDRRHVAVVAAQKEISRIAEALPYIVQLDELGYVVAKDLQVKAAQQLGSDTPLSTFGMRLGRALRMAFPDGGFAEQKIPKRPCDDRQPEGYKDLRLV
ncbi:hypothetical protein RvY_10319 [Ramazzottius varieornatus]|uniref:Uncharacterized protein n=1 Tax=Ramazzottius varieornatus TaxID=947166 RepID=A0A1D1VCD1_RAMVA|nr:hypothetical protein RvY_10319 [Ramazzottius varieornatus]